MPRTLTPVAAALAALAGPLHADIVSVSGDVSAIAPPPSTLATDLATSGHGYVFQERDNVTFDGFVNRINLVVGFQYQVTDAFNVAYSGVVDSHLIHFDNTGLGDTAPADGSVQFDGEIVAIIFTNTHLDNSDAALGAPGTSYPAGLTNRGISSTDWLKLTAPDTLSFHLINGGAMDQVRVLTVPAPGAAVALLLGVPLVGRRRR